MLLLVLVCVLCHMPHTRSILLALLLLLLLVLMVTTCMRSCCCTAHELYHFAGSLVFVQHLLQQPHCLTDRRLRPIAAHGQLRVAAHAAQRGFDEGFLQQLQGFLLC
jgi:hypothetical protein